MDWLNAGISDDQTKGSVRQGAARMLADGVAPLTHLRGATLAASILRFMVFLEQWMALREPESHCPLCLYLVVAYVR